MEVSGGQESLIIRSDLGTLIIIYLVVFQVRVDRGVGGKPRVWPSYEHNGAFLTHFVPSFLSW